MRLLLWLLATLLVGLQVVVAADCVQVALSVIPSCAQSCFIDGAPSVGCGGTDFECQCQQEARLYAAVEGCVATGCPAASFQAVIDGASSVCNCAVGGLGGGGSTVSGSYVSMPSVPPTSASSPQTTGGASTTKSSYPGGPVPTPTIPSITSATGATSGAERLATRSYLLAGITGALLVAVTMQ